jgi:hypothetical protein
LFRHGISFRSAARSANDHRADRCDFASRTAAEGRGVGGARGAFDAGRASASVAPSPRIGTTCDSNQQTAGARRSPAPLPMGGTWRCLCLSGSLVHAREVWTAQSRSP